MPTVNIRIVELLTKENHSVINSFHIIVRTSCYPFHNTKMKIYEDKYSHILSGDKPSFVFVPNQHGNFLNIDLKRYRFISKDDLLGQLVLPLEWFPTNHLVREWFPIQKAGEFQGGMILLDVHVDTRSVQPFMAPFAGLTVFPCWKRPTLCQNSEIPVISPVVYIVSPEQNIILENKDQNLMPKFRNYADVANVPMNPYSNRRKENIITVNYPNLENPYDQQTEQIINQENQIGTQLQQELQMQQNSHLQIYSVDISDDENGKENNENMFQQQQQNLHSIPDADQYSSTYDPSVEYQPLVL